MIRLATSNFFDPHFYSLSNTNFVVLVAFLIFVAFLIYKGVPKLIGSLLDKRSNSIRNELKEAKNLREEAQEIFASYERKMVEVEKESAEIVTAAKKIATEQAKAAKLALAEQIDRRVAAGKDQIVAAEAAVERQIRTKAASIAVEVARDVLGAQLKGKNADALIDAAIKDVDANLN